MSMTLNFDSMLVIVLAGAPESATRCHCVLQLTAMHLFVRVIITDSRPRMRFLEKQGRQAESEMQYLERCESAFRATHGRTPVMYVICSV
eukprot:1122046-Pleurochrysis_carterae.AAC.8